MPSDFVVQDFADPVKYESPARPIRTEGADTAVDAFFRICYYPYFQGEIVRIGYPAGVRCASV